MATIYLDHNILIYLHGNQNGKYDATLDRIHNDLELNFVFSLWNLVEIATGEHRGSANQLAKLVDSLNPLWIVDRKYIQKEEIRTFLFSNYYGSKIALEFDPIRQTLSEAFYCLDPSTVKICDNAEKSIAVWTTNPSSLNNILQVKSDTPDALTTIQNARMKKQITNEQTRLIEKTYLGYLLPSRDPDGSPLNSDQKNDILTYIIKHKKELYKSCPCLNVEDKLSDFRTRQPKRIPEEQDALDLQHAVTSLAYCDYVISNDGYFCSGADFVLKHCNFSKPVIFSDLNDLP